MYAHHSSISYFFISHKDKLLCYINFILGQDLPKPVRANFILNVETDELFITAGLQDRVVQVLHILLTHLIYAVRNMSKAFIFLKVYEGLVYMDFSKHLMDERGYGITFL